MKKTIAVILSIMFIFALIGCSDKNANKPSSSENESQVAGKYEAKKAAPENLPVYPDAILVHDMETIWSDANANYWSWMYVTTGSGNEIVEFFVPKSCRHIQG